MSTQYINTVKGHTIHAAFAPVNALLKNLKEKDVLSINDSEALLRVEYILTNFSEALQTYDEQLVSIAWLDEASNAIANIVSYLTNYQSSNNATFITSNMTPQLDILLNATARINMVKSKQSLQGVMSSVNKYQQSMQEYLDNAADKYSDLINKSVDFSKRVEQINNDLTAKLTILENSITQEKVRLDNLNNTHQNQMSTNQTSFLVQQKEFQTIFTDNQSKQNTTYSELKDTFNNEKKVLVEKFNLQIVQLEEKTNSLIKENRESLEKYQEEVKNIVGIVNTNMFSHKYKEVADNAQKRARLWHVLAVILMIALGVFAIYAFVITTNQDTSWVKLVAKMFAATTMATGAAYAARQASKQEKVERYSRKIEMEMVAIDPFLESLGDEKRQAVKEEIARQIFGKTDSMEITSSDEANFDLNKGFSINELIKLISTLHKFGK